MGKSTHVRCLEEEEVHVDGIVGWLVACAGWRVISCSLAIGDAKEAILILRHWRLLARLFLFLCGRFPVIPALGFWSLHLRSQGCAGVIHAIIRSLRKVTAFANAPHLKKASGLPYNISGLRRLYLGFGIKSGYIGWRSCV